MRVAGPSGDLIKCPTRCVALIALFLLLMTWISTVIYFQLGDLISKAFVSRVARTQAYLTCVRGLVLSRRWLIRHHGRSSKVLAQTLVGKQRVIEHPELAEILPSMNRIGHEHQYLA
jgi:hypothetical protein